MTRTFKTHEIRKQEELTGTLWEFTALEGEFSGKKYKVATPSCWENQPDFSDYRGEAIYSRTFEAGGNIRLEFKGVSHTATVFLDGKKIAEHYNAYTAFSAVIKDLAYGIHTLEVKVDNRFGEASALHIPNDYMTYGGISRPVVLEQLYDLFIEYIHITPFYRNNCWNAKVSMAVNNIGNKAEAFTAVLELADKTYEWNETAEPNEKAFLEAELSFEGIKEWAFETPVLYTAKASLIKDGKEIDDLIDRTGFREVQISENKILLNGKKVRIKGVCRHEDHPQFGCALPFAAIASDLAIIRDLGANAVRTSHYPNDEIFLDLCDETGILVWEENHARGLSLENMQNPNFEPQAENVIREMIPLHFNHPCIFIWGILNECASHTEFGRDCYKKQFEIIKELDLSRPTSFASCRFNDDISLGLPDIVSYNIYPMWYQDTPVDKYLDELYKWVQKDTEGAGKPFIVSEIGAGGIYGWRNNYDGKWTEDYQAKALEKQITTCLEYDGCCGVFIWQFCDIRICQDWFFTRPRCMNNKGIVDEFRRKKMAYNVVKTIYAQYGNYFE